MKYTVTIYRRPGVEPHPREPLYAIWIGTPGAEPQPGAVWQVVQTVEVTTEEPIPAVLCGLLLASETTSDCLARHIADTWLGPVEDDALNDYDRYVSREELKTMLDKDYLDRLD